MTAYPGCFAILVLFVLTAFGVWLLRRGRRGVLRGTAPHCRKCGYNLTGRSSDRCSECGADLNEADAVTVGHRSPRLGLLLTGCVIALVGSVPLLRLGYVFFATERWYQYAPTRWVLADAQSADPNRCDRAIRVLLDRQFEGDLATEETRDFIATCQAWNNTLTRSSPLRATIVDALNSLGQSGLLREEQHERFLKSLLHVELHVRPRVLSGWKIPVEVRVNSVNLINLGTLSTVPELSLDDRPLDIRELSEELNDRGDTGIHALWLPSSDLGKHKLTVLVATEVRQFAGSAQNLELVFRREWKWPLAAEFVVIEHGHDAEIKITRTPDIDAAIPGCFAMRSCEVSDRYSDDKGQFCTTVSGQLQATGPLPIGVAFDILVESAGQSWDVGRIAAAKGAYKAPSYIDFNGILPSKPPRHVDIVLRPSTDAAMNTVDIYEIWGGEIRFPEIYASVHASP